VLKTEYLAHFELPDSIHIQLREASGEPFTRFSVPVIVQYGYELPPLRTDAQGQVLVTKEMFLSVQAEELGAGLMDNKGDYSLNRFVRIRIPNRSQALKMAAARASWGLPLYPSEKELYRNMRILTAAYVPSEDILPFMVLVDLLDRPSTVSLEPIVSVV
jgi:hypothetical protein